MASITIRNLDDNLKALLRTQAAQHGCSMEQEVRELLRQVVMPAGNESGFAQRISQHFAGLKIPPLPIPARQKARKPPKIAK